MKQKSTRKIVCLLTVLILAVSIAIPFASATNRRYEVNSNNVNLRSGPGTAYSSYGQMQKGHAFYSDPINNDANWSYGNVGYGSPIYVFYGYAVTGYVQSSLITPA